MLIVQLDSHSPNDVVFYFPRCKRELWANSTALAQASTCWATLFDSGFAESETQARDSTASQVTIEQIDGDDSDDECDSLPLKGVAVRQNSSIPAGVKKVVVKNAVYTTYRAVLLYTQSGYIDFAPLAAPPSASLTRKASLAARMTALKAGQTAGLPLAASPKSVYKLAHRLEYASLAKLALASIESQLTPENVVYQLTTDISIYDDVRKSLVSFATANWDTVREMETTRELHKAEVIEAFPNVAIAAAPIFALALTCKNVSA